MSRLKPQDNSTATKRRFERDANAFDAIYDDKSEFSWFNKIFRKPIFERYDITFQVMGRLEKKTVLDVGCGSGVYSTQCALNGAPRVKGIDFSKPMLDIARSRAITYNVVKQCEFEEIDFLHMDTCEQFNFSIAMGVFDYLTDPLPFLKKLKSVTTDKIIASFPGHSLFREPLRKLRYLITAKGRVYFYSRHDIENLVDQLQVRDYEIHPFNTGSGFVLVVSV